MAAESQMRSSSFLHLPSEVFSQILKYNVLVDSDVCNVSRVCKKFHNFCFRNEIWKVKFRQRWPLSFRKWPNSQWFDLYKTRYLVASQVHQLVYSLAEDYYHRNDISNEGFYEFYKLFDLHPQASMFVLDELHLILFAGDSNAHLTERYYAEKAFYNLQHAALRSEIRQFLNLPPESQKIEIGAMMVSRWFQPGLAVSHDIVCKQLDDIADRVRKQLRQMLPDVHPACEKSYLEAGLTESLWTPTQCRQVLEAINIVLYQHMGFAPSETTSYMACNSYLDKVLEKKMGFPITLCILYSAVARRLGIVCELVNFPAYFLLRWKENPMAPTEGQYTFIDAYGHGQMLSHKECLAFLGQFGTDTVVATALYAATTTAKVLEIMARNLVRIARCLNHHGRDRTQMLRFAIGLHLAISPDDAEMQLMQVRLFLHLNINLKDAIENLQQVAAVDDVVSFLTKEIYTLMKENETRDNERHMVQEKLRKDNAEVHFSVGMVMKHKKYHYTCVIYGWDKEGRISEEWITQEGVGNLHGRPFQPFYNVLAEDGSNRYAAQENLVYAKDVKAITHPEVGKYFEKFTGKFYVPNKMKQEEYPDDAEMTGRLVTQYFLSTK